MDQDSVLVTHRKIGVEGGIELTPTISRTPITASSKTRSVHHCSIPAALNEIAVGQDETNDYTTTTLASSNLQTKKQKIAEGLQLCACCWFAFIIGWNDGSTGPLLPRIQEVYHVGFTLVSMIFVCTTAGFILGAFMNFFLTVRLGFGKTILLGALCQVITYSVQVPAPPFPVFVISYVINGFGLALELSQTIGLVASLKHHADIKMGFFHAFYGLGALSAPFVATQFAQRTHWSYHYLISLLLSILNCISFYTIIGFKTQDECLKLIGQDVGEKSTSQDSSFNQVLRIKAVHFLAFFILFYVGAEVTIGGWVVTFMLDVRGGGPTTGYISSGFFGGLMLGRILLLWVNKKLGERLAIFLYGLLAIGRLIVWLVPSLIGGAISVSFVGLLMGPMYPIAMVHAGRVLPAWLLTSAVGWISGFGQAGSAALPFMTGAISQKYGIKSLQPLVIAMMGFMILLWYLVPARKHEL